MLFVPTAFLIAATGGFALGLVLLNKQSAARLALWSALASGLAFLVVNMIMNALGSVDILDYVILSKPLRGERRISASVGLFWLTTWRLFVAPLLRVTYLVKCQHSLGWQVGAPGAAERYTTITVLMTGNLGAALAWGAVIGVLLSRPPN